MKRFNNVAGRALGAGLAVAAAGVFVISGASAQSTYDMAKEEGKLTLYSDQTIETIQALADGYKAKYPGIDVDFFRSDSTKLMQRFETESAAGRHEADVMTTVDRLVKTLVKKGLTQEYRSAQLSNYPEDLHVANGQYSNWGVSLTSFAYNTDELSEAEAPKDWEDLLDPKWKGKIGMQDPLSGGGAKMWVVTMYRELGADKWEDFMTKLASQDIIYGSYLPIREMLISGEITIQVAAYPDFTEPVRVDGAPVNWSAPRFLGFVGLTAFVRRGPIARRNALRITPRERGTRHVSGLHHSDNRRARKRDIFASTDSCGSSPPQMMRTSSKCCSVRYSWPKAVLRDKSCSGDRPEPSLPGGPTPDQMGGRSNELPVDKS